MRLRKKLALGRSVLRYRLGRRSTPVAIAWLVTGRCTGTCSYCRWKGLRASDELDTVTAHRLIDEMADAGVQLLSFTGGEPLLREDLGALISRAKQRGMVCKVNTNGALVAERLSELRMVDILQVSLDGPAEVNDRHRGAGTAGASLAAVREAKRAGIPVQLVACLTATNVRQIDAVLNCAASVESPIYFQPLAPGSSAHDASPSRDALLSGLGRLRALKRRGRGSGRLIGTTDGELRYYMEVLRGDAGGCHCALVTATMLPDGGLIFCGNGRDQQPIDATKLGFAAAFARLSIPDCDGCTCVGKLRISRAFQLDPRVLFDLARR